MSIVKSDFCDFQVAEVPIHVATFMKFAEHGDKVALVDGLTGKQYTYTEVIAVCHRVASGLARLGVKKGDVVAMFSYNSVEWIFMFWGVLCAGGTVTSVNPAYTKYELVHHLKDSAAKFLFTAGDMVGISKAAVSEVAKVKNLIVSKDCPGDCVAFDNLMNDNGDLWPELEQLEYNPREDIAIIPYSSGTTGLPKGVLITHYNIVAMALMFSHPEFVDPKRMAAIAAGYQDTALVVLPMYHAYGLVGLLIMCMAGGLRLVIMPKFEPKSFLGAIEKFKVTILPLVPPIVIFLAKSPLVLQYNLSSVQRVGSGAAPLSRQLEQELQKRIKVPEMRQGYGLSETTVAVTSFSPLREARLGSCGQLMPGTEAKIVDTSSGQMLGPNEQGEIWVRGPQVMKGYLNNPQATTECLDQDGFLHTGDIAYYDKDGYFYIVDRMKELIKVKGYQVAPAELEALLLEHSKVADAGVVGIPDERAGELPRAYIVKKAGVPVTEDELHAYVAERLAPYKQLKGGVYFIREIPRLPSGKIVRRKLKQMAATSKI